MTTLAQRFWPRVRPMRARHACMAEHQEQAERIRELEQEIERLRAYAGTTHQGHAMGEGWYSVREVEMMFLALGVSQAQADEALQQEREG